VTSDRTRGLVIVNTGDGKGKSSSAFGVMLRAVARGWKVIVIQFIKSDKWQTGERKMAEQLGVDWITGGDGFTWESNDMEATVEAARDAWGRARTILAEGEYDLVILDEATYPVSFEWIAVGDVVDAITGRPTHTNVIITGRDADDALIEIADTVTEMRKVKHVFDEGISARKGLDF
jgi:cob(I)alamin adenosyltransferase